MAGSNTEIQGTAAQFPCPRAALHDEAFADLAQCVHDGVFGVTSNKLGKWMTLEGYGFSRWVVSENSL
jgi:hypothetical protein